MIPDNQNQTGASCFGATILDAQAVNVVLPESLLEFSPSHGPRLVVVFRSEQTGAGNPVLGDQLTGEFLRALLTHPEAPAAILLYNSAVHLAQADSPVLTTLQTLAGRGCDILVCKTSLQILTPHDRPAVGRSADMVEMLDYLRQADKILWP